VTPKKAYESEEETFNPTLRLDQALIERVGAVDGVEKAEGAFDAGRRHRQGREYLGSSGGAPAFLTAVTSNAENTAEITAGALPDARGEVAIDKGTADDNDIAVGDRVSVTTTDGLADVTVAGVFESEIDIGGASIVLATLPTCRPGATGRARSPTSRRSARRACPRPS
jgi:hypothetical protein